MNEKLQELLNRKPNKWGNVSVKTFRQDILLLQTTIKKQQKEIEELKQQLSGDTPNCYECGEEIDFDGKYSKFTKTIEESKVINVCKSCF